MKKKTLLNGVQVNINQPKLKTFQKRAGNLKWWSVGTRRLVFVVVYWLYSVYVK